MAASNPVTRICLAAGFALAGLAGCAISPDDAGGHRMSDAEIVANARDWRQGREARLTEPYGWLSLVGLEYLDKDGSYTIGRAPTNDIRVPNGPAVWGRIRVQGDRVGFLNTAGEAVRINGEVRENTLLRLDDGDGPTTVSSTTVRFHLIERGEGHALRIRDSQAPTRLDFTGLDWYAPDPDWRIHARWEPHPPGRTLEIANVLGDLLAEPNPGRAVFERNGRTYSLEAVDSGDDLWFIFADRTSGHDTYGLGRFLYADLPVDGEIILDFNLAYNPPCAFNEYTTCPLPPQVNRLDLAVEAGEKKYPGGD